MDFWTANALSFFIAPKWCWIQNAHAKNVCIALFLSCKVSHTCKSPSLHKIVYIIHHLGLPCSHPFCLDLILPVALIGVCVLVFATDNEVARAYIYTHYRPPEFPPWLACTQTIISIHLINVIYPPIPAYVGAFTVYIPLVREELLLRFFLDGRLQETPFGWYMFHRWFSASQHYSKVNTVQILHLTGFSFASRLWTFWFPLVWWFYVAIENYVSSCMHLCFCHHTYVTHCIAHDMNPNGSYVGQGVTPTRIYYCLTIS